MATLYHHLLNVIQEKADPRSAHLPLVESPFGCLAILVFYNFFVNKWGPHLMKTRKPFNLKYVMIFYNIVQVVVNAYLFWMSARVAILTRHQVCQEVDYSDDPYAIEILHYAWMYFCVKVLDLLDTVFMVLRKRDQQITFLHVYHHSGMVIVGWIGIKFLPGGNGLVVGNINTFVHAVMYFYYLLSTLDPEYKKSIWWKKHLTQLQMVQFIILAVHSSLAVVHPTCKFPKIATFLFTIQNLFIFHMFWDFYKKAYLSGKETDGTNINGAEEKKIEKATINNNIKNVKSK